MAWIKVFDDDICNIMPKPTGSNSAAESQKFRDRENRIRLTPKPPQEYATHLPKPCTPLREARVSAPSKAPTPVAPIRIPKPRTPPCRILSAKIGIRIV